MTHRITLLRHGLSVANQNGVVQGQMDSPLSEVGVRQAQLLAARWQATGVGFDYMLASPLRRARTTAEIIAIALGLEVEYQEHWLERLAGVAEGKTYEEIDSTLLNGVQPSSHDPLFEDGESEWDLFLRAAAAVQDLVRRPAGRYLVVAHGAILAAVMRSILGLTPPHGRVRPVRLSFENTGYSILSYDDDAARWTLHKHNLTDHLIEVGEDHSPVNG